MRTRLQSRFEQAASPDHQWSLTSIPFGRGDGNPKYVAIARLHVGR